MRQKSLGTSVLEQGWTDVSRVRDTSNFFKVLRSTQSRRCSDPKEGLGEGGPPVNRDRLNGHPDSREALRILRDPRTTV
ncbi:hypothetical protein TNCV_3094421 [Trichonephila clavipes]|nr:hypothetical protein TNCV_3094421 [Trichonephila clavipes]